MDSGIIALAAIEQQKKIEFLRRKVTLLNRKKNGISRMNELIKEFIGKECVIYAFEDQITGKVRDIKDNWIIIETKRNTEAVNIDYVKRIKEKD